MDVTLANERLFPANLIFTCMVLLIPGNGRTLYASALPVPVNLIIGPIASMAKRCGVMSPITQAVNLYFYIFGKPKGETTS